MHGQYLAFLFGIFCMAIFIFFFYEQFFQFYQIFQKLLNLKIFVRISKIVELDNFVRVFQFCLNFPILSELSILF